MAELSRQIFPVGNARIEVILGGSGQPIVCTTHPIEGAGVQRCRWHAQHARAVGVMPRGIEGSSPAHGKEELSTERLIQDMEAVRRSLGYQRWVVEGYSGGCTVALAYALSYPHALEGLIVGFGAANYRDMSRKSRSILSPAYPAYQQMLANAARQLETAPETENHHWQQLADQLWVLIREQQPAIMLPGTPNEHLTAYLEYIGSFDVCARLRDIRVPTLVVCGRHDPLIPTDMCLELHRGIPGAELLLLEQSGHGVSEAEMELFHDTVKGFLSP